MTTLECPRCGVRWDESWSRLCWVCGTPGSSVVPVRIDSAWRYYPRRPVFEAIWTEGMGRGRPFADLPPAPEQLVQREEETA